ncbi:PVC-type heme-binding CxxCH protein [Negadavirga shengliensis]|uniref:PVC-type heme-binding CxxCH protein n=1 Tax=Negadavirga shengliensis TaxID=1389218 RepID=A0ABV9T4K1_9BACT
MELIASEPLIADPVDMEIDELGRLYVVEMHGYPLDVSGTGKIKLLSDTDGDGVMDKSVVFADSLILPTGILRWKNGILVTDPPHVLYFEDTNGDGRADKKEVVLTGFARSNPQHNFNSPRYGFDNWIYVGHEPAVTTVLYAEEFGDQGSEIRFPAAPEGPVLPVNAGGRSIRFHPDKQELELLASRTQFGHTFSNWGDRFLVNNNNHVIHEVIPARYLDQNRYFPVANATQSISDHGNAAEVYPITDNPEHQLLTDIGVMTSACGITAYQGGIFPEPYDKVIFTAEPVSNLLHADVVEPQGATFVARRLLQNKEFLASRDAWFRPVNMYIGPDGALYVVDYYRQIIEHPEWMDDEVVASGALYNGTDKGRIYRISPKGSQPLDWSMNMDLGNSSTGKLVAMLASDNIWWRRNAQRLLVDRGGDEATAYLEKLLDNASPAVGRFHALWTLHGLGELKPEMIEKAMRDSEAGVRRTAVMLTELYPQYKKRWKRTLFGMHGDPDPKVRHQLLLTLAGYGGDEVSGVRRELLLKDLEDDWVQVGTLVAPIAQHRDLLAHVLEVYDPERPAFDPLVRKLASMEMQAKGFSETVPLLEKILVADRVDGWEGPLLLGFADGLKSSVSGNGDWLRLMDPMVKAVFDHPSLTVRRAAVQLLQTRPWPGDRSAEKDIGRAVDMALDRERDVEARVVALNFLELPTVREEDREELKKLMGPGEPVPVQTALLKILSRQPATEYAAYLMANWQMFSPEVRNVAVQTLLVSRERMGLLLDGIEYGPIQPGHVGWMNSVRLMNQSDETLRNRSRRLLSFEKGERKEVIEDYRVALELKGDPRKGLEVYQENCAVCHKMTDKLGYAFGPDLASLRNRRYENILGDILDPNMSIADGYDLWSVELNSGENFQGIISSETPSAINLANAGGQEVTIARKDIKNLQALDVSAMPAGLENNINHQQMADLLEFIKRTNLD